MGEHKNPQGWPCVGKYVGFVDDRLITPFVRVTYYGRYKCIEFPFVYDNDYQKKRFYKDEIGLSEKDFNKLTRDKYNETPPTP